METNTIDSKNFNDSSTQLWLANILEENSKQHSPFSLRAFARKVEVSPAVLSRVLAGKRKLTFNLAVRIADALSLGPSEREQLYSFYLTYSSDEKSLEVKKEKEESIDCFNALKDWYHYGITQLLFIETFNEDPKWIAKMLSITELEAKLGLDRLIRLNILARDSDGKIYRTKFHLSASTDIASAGLKHFQKQILEKSINSLEIDDLSERDITSITIAVNEDQIQEVKKEIKIFRKKMSELLTTGKKTRVYNLGVHLYPLSKSSKTNE